MKSSLVSLPGPSLSPSAVNLRGSILIVALWSLCLLAAFAVIVGYEVRQKAELAKRLDERDKLRLIAEAGIKKGILQISKQEQKSYAALGDDWSNNPELFCGIKVGDGQFTVGYNYYDEASGTYALWCGIIDEERKININTADLAVLTRLFKNLLQFDEASAQELAAAIIDWRDSDSELSIPIGSAEDSYYRNLEHYYQAKDAKFECLDELLLVKGMAADIFFKVKEYITIYGTGKVNINTASVPVLLALGLREDIVGKIITWRCGEDGVAGTSDDRVFETNFDIVPDLSQAFRLGDSDIAELSQVVDQCLATDSHYFMIKSVAGLNNRKNTAETVCVVNALGKVLYWQEP